MSIAAGPCIRMWRLLTAMMCSAYVVVFPVPLEPVDTRIEGRRVIMGSMSHDLPYHVDPEDFFAERRGPVLALTFRSYRTRVLAV